MTTPGKSLKHRLFYFACIGGLASLVNIGVVSFLVSLLSISPLVANIFAFATAFNISYFGHRHVTFSQLQDKTQLRLPHFFLIALSALLINESLYFLLLHYTSLHYLLSLVLVLGLVSAYSFILSHIWACR